MLFWWRSSSSSGVISSWWNRFASRSARVSSRLGSCCSADWAAAMSEIELYHLGIPYIEGYGPALRQVKHVRHGHTETRLG